MERIVERVVKGELELSKNGIYLTAVTDKGRIVKISYVNVPELRTFGISNVTADRKYVLFLDYDDISEEELERELVAISKRFLVGHFLVLRTDERKFHAICFEKFDLDYLINIINNTACDYKFKIVPMRTEKSWILRVFPKVDNSGNVIKDKPKFHNFYLMSENSREISRGHFSFFSAFYPELGKYGKIFERNFDNNFAVKTISYGTSAKNLLGEFGIEIERLGVMIEEGEEEDGIQKDI